MKLRGDLTAMLVQAGLDVRAVEDLVRAALAEDLDGGVDVTSVATVPASQRRVADFVARADGVVAGLPVAEVAMHVASDGDLAVDRPVQDGSLVRAGDILLSVEGPTLALLTGERTALNLLCHLSGVATATRRWVDALAGSPTRVRDTRKTTPLLRSLEKYAVRCGGGVNHRMSLSDAALVKDNHVLAAGGVTEAFRRVRARFPQVPVEVEVDSVDEAVAAVAAGAELILLDNMMINEIREAVRAVGGRCRLEVSGGLTLATAADVAATGVDFVAVGALTHSAGILDVALDLREEGSGLRDRPQAGERGGA